MLDRYQQYHKHSLWVSETKCRFCNSPLGDPHIFFMSSAKSSDCSQTTGSRAKWCAVCIPKCFGVIGLLIHLDPPGKPTRGQMGKRSPRVPLVANQTKTHTYTIFLHPRKVRDLPIAWAKCNIACFWSTIWMHIACFEACAHSASWPSTSGSSARAFISCTPYCTSMAPSDLKQPISTPNPL